MITLVELIPILLCAALVRAIELPPEPALPATVCVELKAEIRESPAGFIPEAAESRPDTARVQRALDGCPAGQAVKLVAGRGNAFLAGHLALPSGVTLWIDAGVTLFASRNPRDYDVTANSCGTPDGTNDGCLPLIGVRNATAAGIVGDGVIDGRGGQRMIGSNETWWELAWKVKSANTEQSCPRLVMVEDSEDFLMYRIRLHNSPFWHFATENVTGMIIWGVKVDTPSVAYPADTRARNTDGLDPNGKNIVITQCYINSGDDSIAIKAKKHPVENVLIQDNHFYAGHGMSIGSEINEGAVNVTVRNLTIRDAQNGLRIKSDVSKGGHVRGILYENVCIRNTEKLLVFDTFYSKKPGNKIPHFHDIHVSKTRLISSPLKMAIFRGYNSEVPLKLRLDNVVSDVEVFNLTASNAEITFGPGEVVGIPLADDAETNVKVFRRESEKSTPIDCTNAFVPFPR